MYIYTGTMFMFHDEAVASQMKEVMMGHLNCKSLVQTDVNFYEEIPKEFNFKQNSKLEDINFKLSMETFANGDSEMYFELS